MKPFTTPLAGRGVRALAGAVAALLLAAGGAAAAGPDQGRHHDGRSRGHESWDGHRRHVRHHAPHRVDHRRPTRHVGSWQRPVR